METIDRYEIRGVAGRGGMSTVYVAIDPHFKREVAVKVMTTELLENDTLKARFQQEAQIIAALEHPAIVPVYDFGEDEMRPFLVMRLMQGGTLADRLQTGPLSVKETARILDRVGSALERAHQEGIIHRDLKPSNIMFDQYGDAFLADFGIARLTEGAKTLTGENVIGTPAYMSPEQIHGDRKVDGRSDIYALGVICFEMLTGQRPFNEKTPARLMMQHLIDPVPSICALRPDLPPNMDAVINRSLAKSPDERYAQASELTGTLDTLASVSTPQTPVRPATEASPAADVVGPETGEAAAGAAGDLDIDVTVPDSAEMRAGEAAAAPAPSSSTALSPASAGAESRSGRKKWIVAAMAILAILVVLALGALFFANRMAPSGGVSELAGDSTAVRSNAREADEEVGSAPDDEAEGLVGDAGRERVQTAEPDLLPTAEALVEKFYSHMDAEDYGAAEEAISEAIALAPDEAWLYTERAYLMATLGDLGGALGAVDTAIALEPDNANHYAVKGNILREFGELDPSLANHLQAVELDPQDPYLHLELGMTYMALEQIEQALEQYDHSLAIKDDDPWAYELRSEALFRLGDIDRALADLERAAELDPQGRDFYTRAGEIFLYELDDPERALDYYNLAVERAPEDGWVYANRAEAADALGEPEAALDDLTHAIELIPDESHFYIRRGMLRVDAFDDADGALADLNHAVEIAPENPDAYAERANFYHYYAGDPEAALADRDRALELEPDGPWRYVDRALVLRELGREDEAMADLQHCLDFAPEYYWCAWERAWLYEAMGEPKAAAADFERFLEFAPEDDCPECHEEAERYIQENG
jgi:serine/threonine-protein kinase